MDMYRFVAICENDNTSKQLTYTPENFEGVKINREFSFVPPYGFTPKFAVDTMRVIKDDAAFFNDKNTVFGYFLKLKLQVSKLNADGMTYSHFLNLVVNSDTIKKTKDYTEFSVDVVYAATDYFNTKSTKKSYDLDVENNTPEIFKMNNVMLASVDDFNIREEPFVRFADAGNSVIYDSDTSLAWGEHQELANSQIYTLNESPNALLSILVSARIYIEYDIDSVPIGERIAGKKIEVAIAAGLLVTIPGVNYFVADYDEEKKAFILDFDTFYSTNLNQNESILMVANITAENRNLLTKRFFKLSVNVRKKTNIPFNKSYFNSKSLNNLFTEIFGNVSMPDFDLQITSDEELVGKTKKITFAAKDFIREMSIALGLVFNFSDTTTKIERLDSYFNRLNSNERIVIDNYKDLTISNYETAYSSVVFGIEKDKNKDVIYYSAFQKKMTFIQSKNYGDNLDLCLSKLNTNAETFINRIEIGSVNGEKSNDKIYIGTLTARSLSFINFVSVAYDYLTPRDILTNHSQILALYFQNYGNETLTLSDDDGLIYPAKSSFASGGISQHDDFIPLPTNEKHLRPIVYEFTALLDNVDFSEHMAQMVDFNGETVDLFVYSSETTDKLSEIKCKALVYK